MIRSRVEVQRGSLRSSAQSAQLACGGKKKPWSADNLSKLLSTVAASLSIAAVASTIIYLYGFGLGYGQQVLQYCAISDYARLSVQWLAPIVIGVVVTTVLAVPLGRFWWLIDFAVILFVVVFITIGHLSPDTSAQIYDFSLIVIVVGNIVTMTSMAIAGWVVKKKKLDDWKFVAICLVILAMISFALSRGVSAGHLAAHPAKGGGSVYLDAEQKYLRGNLVFAMDGYVLFRVLDGGKLVAIPTSKVKYVETTP